MTVSSDEVFEADHEKIQLDVGGHKLESASSSSASSSSSSSTPATKALLQLRKRTGHGTSTNSTHAATNALKIAKHPTLTFEGVGDYQMHTKLGEGSYGVAYLYQNKKDPKDMMVVKVMKTEDDSKGGVEKAVDFIKGVFNRNAEKRELTPEEKFLMKLETFQVSQ